MAENTQPGRGHQSPQFDFDENLYNLSGEFGRNTGNFQRSGLAAHGSAPCGFGPHYAQNTAVPEVDPQLQYHAQLSNSSFHSFSADNVPAGRLEGNNEEANYVGYGDFGSEYIEGGQNAGYFGDDAFGAGPSNYGFQGLEGPGGFGSFGDIGQVGNTQESSSPHALPYPQAVSPDDGQNLAPVLGYANYGQHFNHNFSEGSSKPNNSGKKSPSENNDEGKNGSIRAEKSEAKPAKKGQVQGDGEHFEWRDPSTKGWKSAVRHHDIREDLQRRAQQAFPTKSYAHADKNGGEAFNDTSFFLRHENWGLPRENRPTILWQWRKTGNEEKEITPEPYRGRAPGFMMFNGKIVLDPHDNPIIDHWNIPATLSPWTCGSKLEAMSRENSRVSHIDFWARMPRVYTQNNKSGPVQKMLGTPNARVNMVMVRFRIEAGCQSWARRAATDTLTAGNRKFYQFHGFDPVLSENSTEGFGRDLLPWEIEEVKLGNAGNYSERAGDRAVDEETRKRRHQKVLKKIEDGKKGATGTRSSAGSERISGKVRESAFDSRDPLGQKRTFEAAGFGAEYDDPFANDDSSSFVPPPSRGSHSYQGSQHSPKTFPATSYLHPYHGHDSSQSRITPGGTVGYMPLGHSSAYGPPNTYGQPQFPVPSQNCGPSQGRPAQPFFGAMPGDGKSNFLQRMKAKTRITRKDRGPRSLGGVFDRIPDLDPVPAASRQEGRIPNTTLDNIHNSESLPVNQAKRQRTQNSSTKESGEGPERWNIDYETNNMRRTNSHNQSDPSGSRQPELSSMHQNPVWHKTPSNQPDSAENSFPGPGSLEPENSRDYILPSFHPSGPGLMDHFGTEREDFLPNLSYNRSATFGDDPEQQQKEEEKPSDRGSIPGSMFETNGGKAATGLSNQSPTEDVGSASVQLPDPGRHRESSSIHGKRTRASLGETNEEESHEKNDPEMKRRHTTQTQVNAPAATSHGRTEKPPSTANLARAQHTNLRPSDYMRHRQGPRQHMADQAAQEPINTGNQHTIDTNPGPPAAPTDYRYVAPTCQEEYRSLEEALLATREAYFEWTRNTPPFTDRTASYASQYNQIVAAFEFAWGMQSPLEAPYLVGLPAWDTSISNWGPHIKDDVYF